MVTGFRDKAFNLMIVSSSILLIKFLRSLLSAKDPTIAINGKSQNVQGKNMLSPSDGINQRHANLKQLYNSSDVMFIDELSDAATDGKSKSPVESLNTIDVCMGSTIQEPVHHLPETCSLAMVSPVDFDNFIIQPTKENNT